MSLFLCHALLVYLHECESLEGEQKKSDLTIKCRLYENTIHENRCRKININVPRGDIGELFAKSS